MAALLTKFILDKKEAYKRNEPSRQGTAKGARIGFMLPKYTAALGCLTKIKPKELAKSVGTTYGTLRGWFIEEEFVKLIEELASEFAEIFLTEFAIYNKLCEDALENGADTSDVFIELFGDLKEYGAVTRSAIAQRLPDIDNPDTNKIFNMAVMLLIHDEDDKSKHSKELKIALEYYTNEMRKKVWDEIIEIMSQQKISDSDRKYVLYFLKKTKPS